MITLHATRGKSAPALGTHWHTFSCAFMYPLHLDSCGHHMQVALAPVLQQFAYGVVREGVIAEKFPQISAKFLQNFCTLSWRNSTYVFANFRDFSAEFPQTFRKNPFANDPISELLSTKITTGGKITTARKFATAYSGSKTLRRVRRNACFSILGIRALVWGSRRDQF